MLRIVPIFVPPTLLRNCANTSLNWQLCQLAPIFMPQLVLGWTRVVCQCVNDNVWEQWQNLKLETHSGPKLLGGYSLVLTPFSNTLAKWQTSPEIWIITNQIGIVKLSTLPHPMFVKFVHMYLSRPVWLYFWTSICLYGHLKHILYNCFELLIFDFFAAEGRRVRVSGVTGGAHSLKCSTLSSSTP